MTKKIIAFAGSNSKTSINKQLATYASSLIKDADVNVLDLNDYKLPMYGVDLETENGFPEDALKFYKLLSNADGLIISLAEHNGAYTTAFKNLMDWLSRVDANMFQAKPMLLMSTSPGARAGQSVFEIAEDRFPRHNANIVAKFSLPSFNDNFKDEKVINPELNNRLKEEVETLVKHL
ncbi:NAD(P)H-dependent oxidoreductase [Olleya sp. YSTF-M6]|uniref:NAD(P)H-dependent oxidoreductase n=1 Tax=Olleya sediminilitoris TaxID=2795739 RepID=A0ABS1WI62_9FLAO|nr:NAD(P)H-dependent oxidoreductase [Olleya sediminilitoris]MBL7558819.1 NAD(P)H-dependent oxidoreductase [Olleya sediminilitoris]